MRALLVVLALEAREAALLGGKGGAGRLGSLGLERLVELLVAAILGGAPGLDELGDDTQRDPPAAEPGEARGSRWRRGGVDPFPWRVLR